MAPRPERPVDAEGTLRFDAPSGKAINMIADGERLRVEMPSWEDARTVWPRSFRGRRRALHSAARVLELHGLVLSVESAGKSVLRLGHNTSPSWLARLLGLAPADIPFSAVRLLFRR